MSVVASFKCDDCKLTCDRTYDSTFCGDCWSNKLERIKELEQEKHDVESERDEAREQLSLEADVFAKQIREKDLIINELLAKVHGA